MRFERPYPPISDMTSRLSRSLKSAGLRSPNVTLLRLSPAGEYLSELWIALELDALNLEVAEGS